MAKEKKTFQFEPLPVVASPEPIEKGIAEKKPRTTTKITFECSNEMVEKMKNFGYWEGLTQKQIIIDSLNHFFENKKEAERPQKIKDRPKVGRKPKY